MRHRPKRENYPRGVYGDIDYQERLERYCTYLENKNKALTDQCNIANVEGQIEQLKCPNCKLDYDKEEIEMFRGLCECCRGYAFSF